jgi:serine/threonine protein kinase
MYCNNCGTQAPDGSAFCSACGLDLAATTPMAAVNVFERESDLDIVRKALQGDYDVKEEIGRGGMATVYRAEEVGLARQVAIKVLPFSHAHDANLVERFQLEARTSAKLEHPNIIPIYRVGREKNVIFFAMRFLPGPSLSELIGEIGPMEPGQISRILIESASALGHAHSSGVVHRDIKPDNIMFRDNGEAVVCDFGIAKAASGTGLTGTGMAIGTPYYMSPEQVRAKPLSGASDIYSLGVVAYQCMTAHVPFDGDDSFAIGYKHVMEDPAPPELTTPEHQKLWTVVSKMLEKHESDRFSTAEELIEALQGERNSISITAKQPVAAITNPDHATQTTPAFPATRPARRASILTPTTPVPRISIEAPRPAGEQKKKRSPLRIAAMLGGVFFLSVGGSMGGGYYYLESGGEIPTAIRQYETTVRARAPWLASAVPLDKWLANGAPVTSNSGLAVTDSVVSSAPMDSTVTDSATADSALALVTDSTALETTAEDTTVVAPEPTTGTLVVGNVGGQASLWIDDNRVNGLRHELPSGEHAIRIVSPGYERYNSTVTVEVGETVSHRARLLRRSQCEQPGDTYNRNGECFDARASMDERTSPLVPIDASIPNQPTTPVKLAIQISPDGSAGTIVVESASDVPQFAILAVNYARELTYHPAVKNGEKVAAWVSIELYAKPR